MKVYTKTGDKGETSLVGGTRVSKNHPRVNAYGNVDELISDTVNLPYSGNLREIQGNLMLVAAHLAADENAAKKLKEFDPAQIEFLESEIDSISAKLPEQKAFILPGTPRAAAECHVARTICRRAERSAIAIMDEPRLEYPVKYLNRLSDYLYVYARYIAMEAGVGDDFWYQ